MPTISGTQFLSVPHRPGAGGEPAATGFDAALSAATIARAPKRTGQQVYVIDDFMGSFVGLEGITHGGLVSAILKAAGLRPNERHWGELGNPELSIAKVTRHIDEITKAHKGSGRSVFVNMSFDVSPARIASHPGEWNAFVAAIKRGIAEGITFVTPGGNTSFNPISSIDGVVTAGARQDARTPAKDRLYVSPETDAVADPRLRVDFRRNGLDVNGDGRPDAPLPPGLDLLVGTHFDVAGTSFSAPRVLIRMTKGEEIHDGHDEPRNRI